MEELVHFQAEQLVQMICYPGGLPSVQLGDEEDEDDEPKQRYQIARILRSVDQWSHRVSWLELQLMIKQALSSVSARPSIVHFSLTPMGCCSVCTNRVCGRRVR